MRCPHCKTENSEGSLLCSRCGKSLTSSSTTQSAFDAPVTATTSTPVAMSGAAAMQSSAIEEGSNYKPSGRMEFSGLPMLLLTGVIAALVVGMVYFFIAQFIDFVIVFPLIAGGAVGAALGAVVTARKIRNPMLVGAVAVLAGLLMMGTMDVARAWSSRGEIIDAFTENEMLLMPTSFTGKDGKKVQLSDAQVGGIEQKLRATIDEEMTPWLTFRIYEEAAAEAGTSIGHVGTKGAPIKGVFYWLLRAAELLAVVLASASIAGSAASAPFCEACQKWQGSKTVLTVHPKQNELLWDKIKARDWEGLLATPRGGTTDDKNITRVKITSCPDCNSGTIGVTSAGGKVPAEFRTRNLSQTSTKEILEKARASTSVNTA